VNPQSLFTTDQEYVLLLSDSDLLRRTSCQAGKFFELQTRSKTGDQPFPRYDEEKMTLFGEKLASLTRSKLKFFKPK